MFKIYVLNHPEFKQRLEIISSKLDNQSISFDVVNKFSPGDFDYDSITNTDYNLHRGILIEQIKGYSYFNNPNKVSPGSISLVLKHMECWKYQIFNNFDYILILEDDCEIPNDFNNLLKSIYSEIENKKYDLIMLGDFLDFKSETDDFISYNKLYKTKDYIYINNNI